MTKNNDPFFVQVNPKELAKELLQAHRELLPKATDDMTNPSYYVVAKLVSNMNKQSWDKLCAECLPEGWCALELSPTSTFVHMANLTAAKRLHSPELVGQMLLAAPFLKQLEHEILRANRGSSPLALVQFLLPQTVPCDLEKTIKILHHAVQKHGNVCDTLGIIDPQHIGLILPGVKNFKATDLVEKILEECAQQDLVLRAGITVLSDPKSDQQKLIGQAVVALQNAIKDNVSLRMYIKPPASLNETRTLVQSHEKRFLFGGGDEV